MTSYSTSNCKADSLSKCDYKNSQLKPDLEQSKSKNKSYKDIMTQIILSTIRKLEEYIDCYEKATGLEKEIAITDAITTYLKQLIKALAKRFGATVASTAFGVFLTNLAIDVFKLEYYERCLKCEDTSNCLFYNEMTSLCGVKKEEEVKIPNEAKSSNKDDSLLYIT